MNIKNVIIGIILGYALNYAWQKMKLYGYGQVIIELGVLSLGLDDLIEMGIGVAVALVYKKEIGIGIIIGILISKVQEIIM